MEEREVLLSLNGTRVDISGTVYKQNLTYIDIPVVVKVYPPIPLPVKLNAFAGPYAGVNIIAKEKVDGSTTDIKDLVETMDFGLTFGAGADFGKITVDGRYSLGLADISKNSAQVLKNGVISMMVGYRLK